MKKILIVLILLTSCSDNYDSNESQLEEMFFINNAYKYNCGKSKTNLNEYEIIRFNELCQEYEKIFLFNEHLLFQRTLLKVDQGSTLQSNKFHRKTNCQYHHSDLHCDITLY